MLRWWTNYGRLDGPKKAYSGAPEPLKALMQPKGIVGKLIVLGQLQIPIFGNYQTALVDSVALRSQPFILTQSGSSEDLRDPSPCSEIDILLTYMILCALWSSTVAHATSDSSAKLGPKGPWCGDGGRNEMRILDVSSRGSPCWLPSPGRRSRESGVRPAS